MTEPERLSQIERRPDPDPTTLTTQALFREVAALRDLFDQKFASVEEQRLAVRELVIRQTDTLTKENSERFVSLRELLAAQVRALGELNAQQFDLIERQRIEQKQDTKAAVDAALTAQKEAVKEQTTASALSITKSETATSKQLEQQQATSVTAVADLRRSIDELKERIGEVDRNARASVSDVGKALNGTVQHTVGSRESFGDMRALALVAFAAAGFIVAVLVALLKP